MLPSFSARALLWTAPSWPPGVVAACPLTKCRTRLCLSKRCPPPALARCSSVGFESGFLLASCSRLKTRACLLTTASTRPPGHPWLAQRLRRRCRCSGCCSAKPSRLLSSSAWSCSHAALVRRSLQCRVLQFWRRRSRWSSQTSCLQVRRHLSWWSCGPWNAPLDMHLAAPRKSSPLLTRTCAAVSLLFMCCWQAARHPDVRACFSFRVARLQRMSATVLLRASLPYRLRRWWGCCVS